MVNIVTRLRSPEIQLDVAAKYLCEEAAQEIIKLRRDTLFLSCLRAAGVDNWEGISDAIDMMPEDSEEDD